MRVGHGVRLAILGAVLACVTAGCGLKGPLSLPEKPSGEVIIRGPQDPAAPQAPQPPPPHTATGEAQGGQP